MKPERIQFAPSFGGDDNVPERDWNATFNVSSTFELAPYSEVPLLAGLLYRARTLPNPPAMSIVVDPGSVHGAGEHSASEHSAGEHSEGGFMSVNLEWKAGGLVTGTELDFAQWVSGLHNHLKVAPEVTN